ncbi:5-methylthioribose kinase [Rhodopirellula rubra]|uniref:5-methylthioribose kinase n=1 Tax=Aporhodopirellula rubra TaxID=980271 RepID=A0A7W5DYB0_9BACT|nr:aminoglycoside phosphotransferase family protein [Aporhodopirellula rubra]MBB3206748.1 5-methylthioribose kinase [Aporhodopirellula rubra]
MTTPFEQQLRDRGFLQTTTPSLKPLTGGVSSEIYLVEDGDRRFVVKRALAKLKVQQDWFADTSRNRSEQAYMRYVASFRPDAMPEIYQCDAEAGLFSMEYLEGYRNWKDDLLAGHCDVDLARRAGVLVGEIHSRTWGDSRIKADFDTIPNFDQLRIDPYLRGTAQKHADLATKMLAEADRLTRSRQCLIHGDYSPKNMMHLDGRLVPLDCEVACFADAAFDLAFLLNHLFLKSLFHVPVELPMPEMISAVREGYGDGNPEHYREVETRAATLLPMLMLARVDGKSPVEYLNVDQQSFVRSFTREHILRDGIPLKQIAENWFQTLQPLMNE